MTQASMIIRTKKSNNLGISKHFANQDGEIIDEKQYITYEIICCTFLLQLLHETQDPISPLHKQMDIASSTNANSTLITNLKDRLIAKGGMDQLSLFLTGPAGAGKTTALEAAEKNAMKSAHHGESFGGRLHFSTQHTQVQQHQYLTDAQK
jgi:flagellar biosynthesis GTPase FlhF